MIFLTVRSLCVVLVLILFFIGFAAQYTDD